MIVCMDLNKTDLLLYHLFAPGYPKRSRSLAVAVKHADVVATVDVKWTEEPLIFYGQVPQEERDIIKVRNDICGITALAGIVKGCGSLSAECWKELSRF